jgi:hypothetical protein
MEVPVNILKNTLVALSCLFTLTSCEDSDNSNVKISVSPDIPVVQNYQFQQGDEVIEPNWFGFVLKIENGSTKLLVINKMEMSVRFSDYKEFSTAEELDPAVTSGDTFLSVAPGVGGFEYELLNEAAFVRYLSDIRPPEADTRFPMNYNYYVKLVATGYFAEPGNAAAPIGEFSQTIYFRTKGPE